MALVKCICFDAVNTLIAVKGSVGAIYREVALRHGISLQEQQLNQGFRKAFAKAPPLCFPGIKKSELTKAEHSWWKNLVSQVISPDLFGTEAKFNHFFEDLYDVFGRGSAWKIYEDVAGCLNMLRDKKIQMRIISNFDSRLHRILHDLELAQFFEKIICSTEVGYAKPQREIFLNAFPAGISAAQIAMIGDEEALDIKPARELGLKALFINRDSRDSLQSLLDLIDY